MGLGPAEAGNLTAYLSGLRPVEHGWTLGEIDRLVFLRYLVERGRLHSCPIDEVVEVSSSSRGCAPTSASSASAESSRRRSDVTRSPSTRSEAFARRLCQRDKDGLVDGGRLDADRFRRRSLGALITKGDKCESRQR
jgi:hypothetical protein